MIEPSPFASSVTVTSCVTTVGAESSTTVTTADAVSEFPASSVTVKTTVFSPRLLQSNVSTSRDKTKSASAVQLLLSVDPLFTSAASIVTEPLASRDAVIS